MALLDLPINVYQVKDVKYISIILILILSVSCSIKNNYKALSFFFDGVPDPGDTLVIPESVINELADNNRFENDTLELKVKRILYHQPYVNKGCSKCHDRNSVGIMIMEEPGICYQCHDNFNNTYNGSLSFCNIYIAYYDKYFTPSCIHSLLRQIYHSVVHTELIMVNLSFRHVYTAYYSKYFILACIQSLCLNITMLIE